MFFSGIAFAAIITNVSDLRQAVWSGLHDGDAFDVTCTVTAATRINSSYWICDSTGNGYVRTTNQTDLTVGSLVRMQGHIGIDQYNWQRAFLERAERIGDGDRPAPVHVRPEQLNDIAFDSRMVIMRGIVTDAVMDDIDPSWTFLVFRSESGPFLAAVSHDVAQKPLDHLIGAEVSAKGMASVLPDGGKRKFKMPQLTVPSIADIAIDVPAPKNVFDSPRIPQNAQGVENFQYQSASIIARMGYRSAEGTVVAVYGQGGNVLIRTDCGQLIGAELKDGAPPSYGERIVVAGFPETDLFMMKFAKASFRRTAIPSTHTFGPVKDLPSPFDMDQVLRDMLGETIRLTGTVIAVDDSGTVGKGLFRMSCGKWLIPVDISAFGSDKVSLSPGSSVAATGVCVFNTENWNPGDIFPCINGFTVVPRVPSDLSVLSQPSWWTAGRLLTVIAILCLSLIAVLVWNFFLRRMIERRGRQIYRTEIEKAEASLRVDERTRLAADLHDSIAQTLTGVSFQIDAAKTTLPENAFVSASFLDIAHHTLLSCREELRRCLWDLRSQVFGDTNFAKALLMAVKPHTEGAEVAVRFNVRRSQLSDFTAHNILCIVRELCSNALRHGHARHVRVAGEKKKRDDPVFCSR